MKANEALIAWNPCNDHWPEHGHVEIGPLLGEHDRDWTKPYSHTGGAAYAAVRKMKGLESVIKMFADFHSLVVRDRVPIGDAHREFLKIDEYRKFIAPDINGAED